MTDNKYKKQKPWRLVLLGQWKCFYISYHWIWGLEINKVALHNYFYICWKELNYYVYLGRLRHTVR